MTGLISLAHLFTCHYSRSVTVSKTGEKKKHWNVRPFNRTDKSEEPGRCVRIISSSKNCPTNKMTGRNRAWLVTFVEKPLSLFYLFIFWGGVGWTGTASYHQLKEKSQIVWWWYCVKTVGRKWRTMTTSSVDFGKVKIINSLVVARRRVFSKTWNSDNLNATTLLMAINMKSLSIFASLFDTFQPCNKRNKEPDKVVVLFFKSNLFLNFWLIYVFFL